MARYPGLTRTPLDLTLNQTKSEMTNLNDSSKNTQETAGTDAAANTSLPKILLVDGAPGSAAAMAAALGGTLIDFSTRESTRLNPLDFCRDPSDVANDIIKLIPAVIDAPALPNPAISTTPFVEPDPSAGTAGMTVFNGLPSPIVCVEINLTTGQTVRVTPQESVEQLRAFAAVARKNAPDGHLVLEHPPAADPLTQELAQQQIDFSRNRTQLPKIDPGQAPAFF